MENFAKKDELKVAQKYLEMIDPMNFMTEEDVKRLVRGEHHSKRTAHRES